MVCPTLCRGRNSRKSATTVSKYSSNVGSPKERVRNEGTPEVIVVPVIGASHPQQTPFRSRRLTLSVIECEFFNRTVAHDSWSYGCCCRRLFFQQGFKGFQVAPDSSSASVPFQFNGTEYTLQHGSVVIAAITSCTNTSNPSVMLGAGWWSASVGSAGSANP